MKPRGIHFKFTFHNVGQGLFYSGHIENAHFIYDCGSTNRKSDVERAVSAFSSRYNHIHCAIISHLHEDHVNGFEYLLRDRVRIDRVIIPYFNPIERAYLLMTSRELPEDDWYIDFLRDPILFFTNQKQVKEVIVVGRGGGEAGPDMGRTEPIVNPEFNDPFAAFDKLEDEPDIREQVRAAEPNYKDYGTKVKYVTHYNNVVIYNCWIFRFFNYLIQDYALLKDFEKCIRNIISDNDMLSLFANSKKRKKARACYDRIKNELKRGQIDPLNNTSLFLYHGPILEDDAYIDYDCIPEECSFINNYHCESCYAPLGQRNIFGHLLTGDADINLQYAEFREHFKTYRNHITHIQVPHHGSLHNWNNEIFGYATNCRHWIVSSRVVNKYGHPNCAVVLDILMNRRYFCWANERQPVLIDGMILG